MENPFENPSIINSDLDSEIKEWIKDKIKNGNFNFHQALNKLEDCTTKKDKDKSKIWAYYCTNMILKNTSYNEHQKAAAISDIYEIVNKSSQ